MCNGLRQNPRTMTIPPYNMGVPKGETIMCSQMIKFRTRVYSDVEVRNPESYYNSVFLDYMDQWQLLDSDDSHCILVESRMSYEYDENNIELLYDAITPEMYESTSRSYVRV